MMWDHGNWGAGDWVAMSLMMVVFWGALVALIVWLVRATRTDREVTPPARPADDVLAERYARGEIDDEEFTRRRALLHTGDRRL